MNYLQSQFLRPGAFLVPLRVFVGLVLLLSGLSKLLDQEWHTGLTLVNFLAEQQQDGAVVFPFYQFLISAVIEPNADLISGIILFAELYSGLAIVLGCFTNLALLCAIFLNLNLLFVGIATPSFFNIATQTILLGMNSGSIFGFDSVISRKIRSSILVAQANETPTQPTRNRAILITSALWFLLFALISIPYIQDGIINPLEDSAASIVVLSVMASIGLLILAFQSNAKTGQILAQKPLQLQGPVPSSTLPQNADQLVSIQVAQSQAQQIYQQATTNQPKQAVQNKKMSTTAMQMNQYAKLLVPHNIEEQSSRSTEKLPKRDRKDDDAPNPLQKLYL